MVEAFLESLIKGIEYLGWSSSKRIAEHTDWALEEIESSLRKLVEEKRILLRKKGRGFQYGPLKNDNNSNCEKPNCRTKTHKVNDDNCRACKIDFLANDLLPGRAETIKRIEGLTPIEAKQTFIDAGILTPNGELAEVYGGKPDTETQNWDSQKMRIPITERIPQSELHYLEPATHRKIDIIEAAHIVLAELPRREFLGKIERNVYLISEIVERLVERWGYLRIVAHEAIITEIQKKKKTIIHMQHRYEIGGWVRYLYRPENDELPEPPDYQEATERSWLTTNAQLGTATANA